VEKIHAEGGFEAVNKQTTGTIPLVWEGPGSLAAILRSASRCKNPEIFIFKALLNSSSLSLSILLRYFQIEKHFLSFRSEYIPTLIFSVSGSIGVFWFEALSPYNMAENNDAALPQGMLSRCTPLPRVLMVTLSWICFADVNILCT